MRNKRLLSTALAAAIILSMQTEAFASEVSNTDEIATSKITTVQDENVVTVFSEEEQNKVSGTCGKNLTWTFNKTTGILTISGNGEMTGHTWSSYNESIKSVVFEGNVTSIDYSAFSGCSNLTDITIPNSVTSIGQYAFSGCGNLKSIVIPDSVISIDGHAFENCSNLSDVMIGKSVTSIGYSAFKSCKRLAKIVIPDSVTSIGNSAFSGCSNLSNIAIGKSVTKIGDSAFNGCDSLTDVVIPDSVTSIGTAFKGLSNLKTVTLGNSVTSIDYSAFSGCSSLTDITIPNSVTSIGQYAFSGCGNLKSIVIPDSVISIDGHAFENCSNLSDVMIGKSVTSIGYSAFKSCKRLAKIVIPDSVTSIGNSAFSGCSNLSNIAIGKSVTKIGDSAFNGCDSLTDVVIPDSVTSIGTAFKGLSNLKTVTLGNSVTSIDYTAFSGCSSLTDITIPNSVTSIGQYAFSGCGNLKSIVISDSVISISSYAFENCSNLSDVYYTGTEEDWKFIKINETGNGYLLSSNIHYNYVIETENKIVSVSDIEVSTTIGIAPSLPQTVTVIYNNGKTADIAVTWDAIDESKYAVIGNFEVEGVIEGFDDKVTCTVTVKEASSDIFVVSYKEVKGYVAAGYVPTLPETVTAVMSDGNEKEVNVIWATPDRNSFMEPGTIVEIKGVALDEMVSLIPNTENSVAPVVRVEVTNPLIVSTNNTEIQTMVGSAPELPETVVVNLSNDTSSQVKVTWDEVDAANYAKVGEFIVNGSILGNGSYNFADENVSTTVSCIVKVIEKVGEKPSQKPTDNVNIVTTNNSANTQNGSTVENVKTGEGSQALPWFAFIASTLTMGFVLALNKIRKVRGKLF